MVIGRNRATEQPSRLSHRCSWPEVAGSLSCSVVEEIARAGWQAYGLFGSKIFRERLLDFSF